MSKCTAYDCYITFIAICTMQQSHNVVVAGFVLKVFYVV